MFYFIIGPLKSLFEGLLSCLLLHEPFVLLFLFIKLSLNLCSFIVSFVVLPTGRLVQWNLEVPELQNEAHEFQWLGLAGTSNTRSVMKLWNWTVAYLTAAVRCEMWVWFLRLPAVQELERGWPSPFWGTPTLPPWKQVWLEFSPAWHLVSAEISCEAVKLVCLM